MYETLRRKTLHDSTIVTPDDNRMETSSNSAGESTAGQRKMANSAITQYFD